MRQRVTSTSETFQSELFLLVSNRYISTQLPFPKSVVNLF